LGEDFTNLRAGFVEVLKSRAMAARAFVRMIAGDDRKSRFAPNILLAREDPAMERLFVCLTRAIALSAALCSCGGRAHTSTSENTATLRAAVSTVGPDGATYTFPFDTGMLLEWNNGSPYGSDWIFFRSDTATESFTVPAGDYTATLESAGDGGGWQLERTTASGTTMVDAVLLDPMPYTFTVPAGGTYDLPIHFRVDGTGEVSFAAGSLNVGLQVSGSPGYTKLQWSETATLSGETLPAGSPLQELLQAPAGTQLQIAVSATIDGPWGMLVDRACTPISATIATVSGETGLAANVLESSGASGELCVYGANGPVGGPPGGSIDLSMWRVGAPQTAAFTSALSTDGGPGDPYYFEFELFGDLPSPVFSGGMLSLDQLAAGLPLTQWNTYLWTFDANTGTYLAQAFFFDQTNDASPGATVTVAR
jgi:hypothetical protein